MSEPHTEEELAAIESRVRALLHSGRGMSIDTLKLLNTDVSRLVSEFRAIRRQLAERSAEGRALNEQLAARDAQIARLRQVVENGAEVVANG
jgi:hypothetical protein